MSVATGLERLADSPSRRLSGARVGMISNLTTVDWRGRHAKDLPLWREKFRDEVPAIDLLFGTPRARKAIDADQNLDAALETLP